MCFVLKIFTFSIARKGPYGFLQKRFLQLRGYHLSCIIYILYFTYIPVLGQRVPIIRSYNICDPAHTCNKIRISKNASHSLWRQRRRGDAIEYLNTVRNAVARVSSMLVVKPCKFLHTRDCDTNTHIHTYVRSVRRKMYSCIYIKYFFVLTAYRTLFEFQKYIYGTKTKKTLRIN